MFKTPLLFCFIACKSDRWRQQFRKQLKIIIIPAVVVLETRINTKVLFFVKNWKFQKILIHSFFSSKENTVGSIEFWWNIGKMERILLKILQWMNGRKNANFLCGVKTFHGICNQRHALWTSVVFAEFGSEHLNWL